MAISSVTSSMKDQLGYAAAKFGFDDIQVQEDLSSLNVWRITCRIGRKQVGISVNDRNPRAWIAAIEKLSRSVDHNTDHIMDLRHNAVESMDDFRALLHKAHVQNRRIDEAWITPEQKQTLITQVDATMIGSSDGVTVQLFGCRLRVEPV